MLDLLSNNKRSHYAANLTKELVGEKVTVMGWVHLRRDLGGLIFIDLRDVTALVQVVFQPENAELQQKAHQIRNEYVVAVTGIVRERQSGNIK